MRSKWKRDHGLWVCNLEGSLEETDSTQDWEAIEFPLVLEVDCTSRRVLDRISNDLVLGVSQNLNLRFFPKNGEVKQATILHEANYGFVRTRPVLVAHPYIHCEHRIKGHGINSRLCAWFEPKSHTAHSSWIFTIHSLRGSKIASRGTTHPVSYNLVISEYWEWVEGCIAVLNSIVESRTTKAN